MKAGIVTSIQQPTRAITALHERLVDAGWELYVAGDRKGPDSFELGGTTFLDIETQESSGFALAADLPTNHYARKNMAYLFALRDGAEALYETDDDNEPIESWAVRDREVTGDLAAEVEWFNPFRVYHDGVIWARGLPLDAITDPATWQLSGDRTTADCPIQQGLADGSPDVDAIWRLTIEEEITFDRGSSIVVPAGTWTPFNSQSTWWWPEAFPLLYLPSHCTFRVTDIWRSLIAQRCLWAMGRQLAVHTAEVFQDRNPHDYMRDFEDEVPGYLGNRRLARVLTDLELDAGEDAVASNMFRCYEALVEEEFFPAVELDLVRAWSADLEDIAAS